MASEGSLAEVWLMGTRYYPVPTHIEMSEEVPESDVDLEQQQFLSDFRSKFWFSYRRGFEPIGNTRYTSDSGWGCMLRSGQMQLGAALCRHFLGPKWRLDDLKDHPEELKKYKMILSWFADRAGSASPYSLPNIALKGVKFDTPVGQWHGPTTSSLILKMLVNQHSPGSLKAYVSQDATVYRQAIAKLCQKEPNSDDWHSVVIFLPVRLGIEFNPAYLPFLTETFKFPQSLGFAGGKLGASLSSVLTLGKVRTQRAVRSMYFVGIDDQDGIYYLDPHKTQDAVSFEDQDGKGPEHFASFHYRQEPKRTTVDQIDPSLTLGFYCRNKAEFEDFCSRVERLGREKRPAVFVIGNKKPKYSDDPNILAEENDLTLRWKKTGEWCNPYQECTSEPNLGLGNPRPSRSELDMVELARFRSSNGDVLGVLVLTQGYVIFEPLKQDPLVRKNGRDKFRWWIRVPFLDDCKLVDSLSELDDRISDDFLIIHSREDEEAPEEAHYSSRTLSSDGHEEHAGSPHRGIGSNATLQNIVHGVDAKALLVEELKASVNWCHFAYIRSKRPITQAIPEVVRLLDALENVFQNGLKEKSALEQISTQIAGLSKGKMKGPSLSSFWGIARRVLCHEHQELLTSSAFTDSEREKIRAFFRICLNESILLNYFNALFQDQELIEQAYLSKAIVKDRAHCEVLRTLFSSLQGIPFQLPIIGFTQNAAEQDNSGLHSEDLLQRVSDEEHEGKGQHVDIPALLPPRNLRLVVRNGPIRECFDLEVPRDREEHITGPILRAISLFRPPLPAS